MGKVVRITSDGQAAEYDAASGTLRIEQPDGGLIIRQAGSDGLGDGSKDAAGAQAHDANLAEYVSTSALNSVASDLLQAIQSDITSSNDRTNDIAKAIKLLAIKVEEPKSAAVTGQSIVRSPLLLKATLAFQANASSELLPASGPVKIRYDGTEGNADSVKLCEDLETDLNHFLTKTASEYYPDTTRMLFDNVGLAGAGFKKVYNCPLRRRPSSESVATEDFIVNAGATDIRNAQRMTQRIMMAHSRLKRFMLSGYYRDVPVNRPTETATDLATVKAQALGLGAVSQMPANHRHTIYECYCELDIPGFEHKDKKGSLTGLELPYRVTIDKDSQQILEIRRDWKEDDPNFERRISFVKYPFIEALGFYGLGLMHLLCNTTEAMTAAWRILLDAGMFSSFPGWLFAKDAGKAQENNTIRVGPGEGQGVQTGGRAIGDVVMPLPYKDPNVAFIELAKLITDAAEQLGGIGETSVGEGKQDAPVGTTIALLEQATKMMAAVHKGLHAAQAEEFQLLKERFREDPEAFWRFNKKPTRAWDQQQFIAALEDGDVVPAADPNTPSHMHRVMRAVGLVQLATAFPQLFGSAGTTEVIKTVLRVLGWETDAYLQPDPPQDPNAAQPQSLPIDPVGMAAVHVKAQSDAAKIQSDTQNKELDRQSRERIAAATIGAKAHSDHKDAALAEKALLLRSHQEALKFATGGLGSGPGARVI